MFKVLIILMIAFGIQASTVQVHDDSIKAGETIHWTIDNTYILNGAVYVEAGAKLIIDSGVTVQAKELGEGVYPPSSLIICRGGRIYANGTKKYPIVFTSERDDPLTVNSFDSLNYAKACFWGGIVILGKASNNFISGQNTIYGLDETKSLYGGGQSPDDGDTSGVLRYVSIRYTGAKLDDDQETSMSGLTLGSVGYGTKIEYVEIYNTSKSAFQWFGGTVGCKYLLAYSRSNLFYYTGGFNGRGQFWTGIVGNSQSYLNQSSGCIFSSIDGGGANTNSSALISSPLISNLTLVMNDNLTYPMVFSNGGAGRFYNAIINTGYQGFNMPSATGTNSSLNQLPAKLKVVNSMWWNIGRGNAIMNNQWTHSRGDDNILGHLPHQYKDSLIAWGDTIKNPIFLSPFDGSVVPFANSTKKMDLRPADLVFASKYYSLPEGTDSLSTAWFNKPFNIEAINEGGTGFLDTVNFRGAFDPEQDTCWWLGWTALDQYGLLLRDYSKTVDGSIKRVDQQETKPIGSVPKTIIHNVNKHQRISFEMKNNVITIKYTIQTPSNISVDVFNLRGVRLRSFQNKMSEPGTHSHSIHISNVATGQYIVKTIIGNKTFSNFLNLIK